MVEKRPVLEGGGQWSTMVGGGLGCGKEAMWKRSDVW